MARNKYPEETVDKIMKVSMELFWTKGYGNTSMQDIVNRLGMSKGAIYHHFSSKEELLKRIVSRFFSNVEWFEAIVSDGSLSGLEKLRSIFFHELRNEEKRKLDSISRPLFRDPTMIAEQIHSAIEEVAPRLVRVIEDGNRDGSLHAEYPKEAAELLLLSFNVWVNPGLFPTDRESFMEKIRFLKYLMDYSGIPVFDDEMMTAAESYYDTSVAGKSR